MTVYATRLENSTDTRPRMRRADSLALTADLVDGPLATRSGLRPGGGEVAAVDGTMQVTVTELVAWIEGGSTDTQVGYPVVSDDVETLLLSDGDPTLERTDTIAVEVRDNTYDASGFTDARVVVVEGTPGAGAPALPATALPLRDVTVTAGLSAGGGGLSGSNIATDRRVYTAALGGILPSAAAPASPYEGQAYYDLATDKLRVFNGTAWGDYTAASDTGWVSLTSSVAGVTAEYRLRNGLASVRLQGSGTVAAAANVTVVAAGLLPASASPEENIWSGGYIAGTGGWIGVNATGLVAVRHSAATSQNGTFAAQYAYVVA